MATKFWFRSTGTASPTPGVHADWQSTASEFIRRPLNDSGSKDNTSFSDHDFGVGGSLVSCCGIQFVSTRPLQAQTISGSVSCFIMAKVTTTGQTFFAFHARVVSSSGSTRGVLLDYTENQDDVISSTSFTHQGHSSISISSVNAQEGDRIVIELGTDIQNDSLKTVEFKIGDPTSSSDITSSSSSTTLATGNVNFSDNITFVSAPSNLTYLVTSSEVPRNQAITNNTASITSGGGTITYTVFSGSLPPGLSLSSSTGTISGTPTTNGTYNFVIRGTNVAGNTNSPTITYVVCTAPADLTYTYTSYRFKKDTAIDTNSATFTDNGGTNTFAIQTGAMPTGLSLSSTTGAITGTPTVRGEYLFTVRVSNVAGSADSPEIEYYTRDGTPGLRLNDKLGISLRL